MAKKILGQEHPLVVGNSIVYQVGGGLSAVISSIVVINTDAVAAETFILYAVPNGGSPGDATAIYKGMLPPGESFTVVAGITLDELEAIYIYNAQTTLTCTVFGDES